MPLETSWHNEEKTILINRFYGNATVADYYQSIEDDANFLGTVDHPVDVILDLTNAQVDAKGLLPALRSADNRVPPNQRNVVVVGSAMYYKVLVNIARTLAPRATANVHTTHTLEEALDYLRQKAEEEV